MWCAGATPRSVTRVGFGRCGGAAAHDPRTVVRRCGRRATHGARLRRRGRCPRADRHLGQVPAGRHRGPSGRTHNGARRLVVRGQRGALRRSDRVRRPLREVRAGAVGHPARQGARQHHLGIGVPHHHHPSHRCPARRPGALVPRGRGHRRHRRDRHHRGGGVRPTRPSRRRASAPRGRRTRLPARAWAASAVLALVPVVLTAQHAAGGGNPHPRYLLPAVPVLAAAVALAVVRLTTRWGAAVLLVALAMLTAVQTRASIRDLEANLLGPAGSPLAGAAGEPWVQALGAVARRGGPGAGGGRAAASAAPSPDARPRRSSERRAA